MRSATEPQCSADLSACVGSSPGLHTPINQRYPHVIMQDVDFSSGIQSAWLGWEHGCQIELN